MRSVDARPTPRLTARHLMNSGALAALALSAAVIAASCSSTNGSGDNPCGSTYAGKCGGTCTSDAACATGLYCKAGTCTADCVAGSKCANGAQCAANGTCSQGSAVTDGSSVTTSTGTPIFVTSSGQGGSTGSTICADVNVDFKQQTPSVMVLVDQSGSMTNKLGTSSRWDSLYNTLMNQTTGVLKLLEKDVRFGVTFYTSNNGFENGGTCPILTKTPIALNNFNAIDTVYHPLKPYPGGDTPTGESISAVVKDLQAYNEDGPKVIVLATDGEPDTCAMPDPEMGQGVSVAAAQDAFSKNIRLFIISVGAETSDKHLQDMANAGTGLAVGGAQNAPFYKALDEAALVSAFQTIIGGVRSCVFQLNGTVDLQDAALGKVLLDDKPLSYNDPNGWKLDSTDQLELVGESCTTIKTGSHKLSVVFPCGVVTPK